MKKKRGLIEQAMHYNQITLLLIFLLVLLGIYGLVKMPK